MVDGFVGAFLLYFWCLYSEKKLRQFASVLVRRRSDNECIMQ